MTASAAGPLAGVRVLGLGRILAGPYTEQLLADFGADVIHVERPGTGDDARSIAPFVEGESVVFLACNRNKRSLTLDTASEAGRAVFLDLVRVSDVVVESNRPGVMDRLGLGYDALRDVNPGIILTSVSGFGQDGPYARLPSYNQIAQAAAGFMSLNGTRDEPVPTNSAVPDYLAGLYGAFGTLVALRAREATGEGQHVDASLFESVALALGPALQEFLSVGTVRPRTGVRAPGFAPCNVFVAADGGSVLVVAVEDRQWRALLEAMDAPGLADDERFATTAARLRNEAAVDAVVGAWVGARPADEAVAALRAAGVPVSPVNDVSDIVADPHVEARGLIATVEHPKLGSLATGGVVPRLTGTPGLVRTPPPALGEHNDEILRELAGLSPAVIADLERAGVV